jgi:hypothetical protein
MCLHTFLYTINVDSIIFKTKSVVARQATVGYWILNNSEIRPTDKAGFDKTRIWRLDL